MGLQQSKGKLVSQQVRDGNSEGILALIREGADLEWMDRKSRTPLIMACRKYELCDVDKTLIELGANVNASRSGRHAGTPLHHAAKNGNVPTVELLLSHGANPLVLNDDCQTPLEVARDKGFGYVVGAIEFCGPADLDLYSGHSLLRVDKGWVVVVPTGSRNPAEPLKLEVAVYDHRLDDQPRTVMPLWKANLEEPITNEADISVMITVDDSTRIPQPIPPAPPLMSETPNTNHHSIGEARSSTAPPPPPSSGKASTSGLNSHESVIVHEPSPSAPPLTDDDDVQTSEEGQIHYPTIDSTPVDVPSSYPLPASAEGEKKEDGSSGQCSICLDAPSDAVCSPCGHVAGCMSCLTEIKSKNYGCPVCRAKIDQIVRLYRV
ncbi:hypothetical protein Bca52824_086750 [Brassica carinata]|uniref:RING-type domain-containing protein n=1 Tax=Brassica carinata TaxID=52824 RepID=A0A8X7PAM5_BRACI|nr:hypothetical protein Bca52824_086750 [Brassica carinata]